LSQRIPVIALSAALIVAVTGAREVRSQGMWIVMTYEPSIAVGDAGDFVDEPGWYGAGLEWRSFKSDHVAWSLSASWQTMYMTTRDLIIMDNVTIGGTQVRYLEFIPLTVGLEYQPLGRRSRFRPYLGVAGGAYYVKQRMEIGTVELIINKNWQAGVVGQAGISFLTPNMDIYGFIGADYNYVFSRGGSIDYTYVTMRLGIVYLL
jgi:hypothetical protein